MGSQLNIQVNAIAFADNQQSNNPMIRHFDLTYKLYGTPANHPDQKMYSVPAGTTQTVYDGTRANSMDGTTQFDVSKPYADKDVYRFTWDGTGTAPAFRTDRVSTIDGTTQFSLTVNGPVATMTATVGPFDTTNIQIGDVLNMLAGAGMSATNQGRFIIIAKTSTSISFKNINAAAESFTVADANLLLIYSNGGSSNQVQIGDKVYINAGFSIATQGTYDIVEITPKWFEIAVGAQNGIPLENNIVPGVSGIVFYKEAKKFALIAAVQKVSVRFNNDTSDNNIIEPVETSNPERPGLLVKNGPFYKLVIANNGLESVDIIVATVE